MRKTASIDLKKKKKIRPTKVRAFTMVIFHFLVSSGTLYNISRLEILSHHILQRM